MLDQLTLPCQARAYHDYGSEYDPAALASITIIEQIGGRREPSAQRTNIIIGVTEKGQIKVKGKNCRIASEGDYAPNDFDIAAIEKVVADFVDYLVKKA